MCNLMPLWVHWKEVKLRRDSVLLYRWGAGSEHLWLHIEEKWWKADTLDKRGKRTSECKVWEVTKSKKEKSDWQTKKNNSTERRRDECKEAMLHGLYLRLGLLGWRRCGCCCCDCCWASPVAMAAPPLLPLLLSWWCCREALLLEREVPCERECWLCPWLWLWPSDGEGFDVPGLLWDFSIVGTCVSKTTRFTKLPKKAIFCGDLRGCYLLCNSLWWKTHWLLRYYI